jgi:hypothetical protein
MKRWKNRFRKSLLESEETSLNLMVFNELSHVWCVLDLLTQNVLDGKYNSMKMLVTSLTMVLQHCNEHECYFRHWSVA